MKRVQQILRSLMSSTPDLEGATVVTPDGRALASTFPAGTDQDRVSAMAAALLSLGERIAGELERGVLEQIYVKGSSGYTVLMHADGEWVLEVVTGPLARLGMVLLEMEEAVRHLNEMSDLAKSTQEIVLAKGTQELSIPATNASDTAGTLFESRY